MVAMSLEALPVILIGIMSPLQRADEGRTIRRDFLHNFVPACHCVGLNLLASWILVKAYGVQRSFLHYHCTAVLTHFLVNRSFA